VADEVFRMSWPPARFQDTRINPLEDDSRRAVLLLRLLVRPVIVSVVWQFRTNFTVVCREIVIIDSSHGASLVCSATALLIST
jgi:hypothetical protein